MKKLETFEYHLPYLYLYIIFFSVLIKFYLKEISTLVTTISFGTLNILSYQSFALFIHYLGNDFSWMISYLTITAI